MSFNYKSALKYWFSFEISRPNILSHAQIFSDIYAK